ncbi:hypothetical protein [Clostridium botulinum]|uniref:hypothetical protein n=1 Tax=Clostridium botulinum TaxID=1491 RepID=UPI0019687D07|nr:hypothetical protein [Clostridium botulinum]MBN1076984.1 hypothetical protein [Clostridium botulinum]
MIRIINNELCLNDGTFYNLSNTSKERVLQGLNFQLQEGSLTKAEYNQCLELISMSKKEELKRLEEVCKPVVDYLKKNYDPHCTVVITDSQIRLVRDEIGIPVGTAQEVPIQEQPKVTFDYFIDKPSKVILTNDEVLYKNLIKNYRTIYMFGPELNKDNNSDHILSINTNDYRLVQIPLDK